MLPWDLSSPWVAELEEAEDDSEDGSEEFEEDDEFDEDEYAEFEDEFDDDEPRPHPHHKSEDWD